MMEETRNYKKEIIDSRQGCLGSSDGKLMKQIVTMGYVPKSAYKRLAILKGIYNGERKDVTTKEMRLGDRMEQEIFRSLEIANEGKRFESNPLWVSGRFSRKDVKLISHPDIVYKDDDNKVLNVYEVKTTKFSWKEARETYKEQLFIHNTIAKEIASSYGKGWKVKMFLVTYNTDGIEFENENDVEFEPERVTIQQIRMVYPLFDIKKCLDIISRFLETFTDYYDGDEIDANYLPANVQNTFSTMCTIVQEIKERETKIEEFKARLYEFMKEKDIKSIKSDEFSITRVDPTESKSVDYKGFFEYYSKVYPVKAKRYAEMYAKMTKKKGYTKITIKNK